MLAEAKRIREELYPHGDRFGGDPLPGAQRVSAGSTEDEVNSLLARPGLKSPLEFLHHAPDLFHIRDEDPIRFSRARDD